MLGRQLLRLRREHTIGRRRLIPFLIGAGLYGLQLSEGVRLVLEPTDGMSVTIVAALMAATYMLGLWRAWELLGAHRFNMLGRVGLLRESEVRAEIHVDAELRSRAHPVPTNTDTEGAPHG